MGWVPRTSTPLGAKVFMAFNGPDLMEVTSMSRLPAMHAGRNLPDHFHRLLDEDADQDDVALLYFSHLVVSIAHAQALRDVHFAARPPDRDIKALIS